MALKNMVPDFVILPNKQPNLRNMELYYLWTEKFKNIEKQGFSFSDKYLISYDPNAGNLSIKPNPQHISNFFPQGITAVTGIIGANGAGKSNLMELLKYTLGSFSQGISAIYEELISVVVFNGDIYHHRNLKINNKDELAALGFSNCYSYEKSLAMHRDESGERMNFDIQTGRLYENGYIYFSNNLDGRTEDHQYETVDISTNSLVWDDKLRAKRANDRYAFRENHLDSLVAFHIEENERQIELLSTEDVELPFKLPRDIIIRSEEDDNRFISVYREWFEESGLSAFKDVWRPGFPQNDDASSEQLKPAYLGNFLYKLLIVLQHNHPNLFQKTTVGEFEAIIQGQFENLAGILDPGLFHVVKEAILSFQELLNHAEVVKKSSHSSLKTLFEKYDSLYLKLTPENYTILLAFHRAYYKAVSGNSFFGFYWSGLSSGEYTLLTMYARFHYAFKSYYIVEKQHLVIMIDEAELSLHPSWQTALLKDLMDYFIRRMPGVTIQIVAASHSPFLVSDLPKSMINFLDKDAQGSCIVVDAMAYQKQTFGANIHTLYSDSFFMNNTLMGKFAKAKIDRLIAVINKDREFDEHEYPDWETVQKTVDLIGEPILRGLLQRQLSAITAVKREDLDELKKQFQVLKQRIDRMEGGSNGTDQ